MPVMFCGIIPDIKKIKSVSKKFNLKIIIDCAGGFIQIIKNKDLLLIFFKYYGVKLKPKFNMIVNKGNPNFMYTKKCDLNIIKYKQKITLKSGIINYIKWQKKK